MPMLVGIFRSIYRDGVICRHRTLKFLVWCVLFGFACTGWMDAGEAKAIRLRNGIIQTSVDVKSLTGLQGAAGDPLLTGLFLVQFTDPLQPAWREELRTRNVSFLRYVPDDAFVVRLDRVRRTQITGLPFVRWLGEYRSEYRIDRRLFLNAKGNSGQPVDVRVLLAPEADRFEVLKVRRALQAISRESQSRFGAVIAGRLLPQWMPVLAASPAVLWIEPVSKMKLFDEVSSKIVGGGETGHGSRSGGPTDPSTAPPGNHATTTQLLGFDGRGVTVSVADSGLGGGTADSTHPDLKGRADAFLYYGRLDGAADGHGHGTHVAGIIAGDGATGEVDGFGALYGLGVAPQAHLVIQRIFDNTGNFEAPPLYETLTRDAVRSGAVIGSNSWGEEAQGRYDLAAHEFDALVRDADPEAPGDQPYVIEFAAGNAGPGAQTIGSPAVAKNVITTGASQNNRFDFFNYTEGAESMADFSSRGPCEDGRIKPDLVAPGTWIASLRSAAAEEENGWGPISPNYQFQGGTSQASPHVSGAAAVFVQFYRDTHAGATPSPALVKAALINSATDMAHESGTQPVPNNDEGWGRVDLARLIGSDRRYEFVEQTNLLATGAVYERRVIVGSVVQPLKITLAYTDAPGLPAAIPALVNDLDLEVAAPNGVIFRGNQFDAGESSPDAPGSDSVNNVEGVHLTVPAPGEYIVRVRARNVAEDVRRDTPAVDQDFALVISGDIPQPGAAVLLLDRPAYTAPGEIRIKLIDLNSAGRNIAGVKVSSSSDPIGKRVELQASGSAGAFTGAVATVAAPAPLGAALAIAHGDRIEVGYMDGTLLRSTIARADLVPPVITNVVSTNWYGRAVVRWRTDEPAGSRILYGTNANLSFSAGDDVFRTEHEVSLYNLAPGTTNQFAVISADLAGNTSTNDNGGQLFTLVPAQTRTVLLVDAYRPDDPAFRTQNIPVSSYTDSLDKIGVSYEVWSVAARGSPGLDDLRPFRVAIWRLNDSVASGDTLTVQQQHLLKSYMDGGGSVLIASMQLLSRLGDDATFRNNVLHVAAFKEDAGVPDALGIESDAISSGMALPLDYSAYESDLLAFLGLEADQSDSLTVASSATPVLFNAAGQAVGLRFPRTGQDSAGRLVFLAFPLDAVPFDGPPPDNRPNLLRNILSFLAPGVSGLGMIAFDAPSYTIPSLVTVEVSDSNLMGQGSTSIQMFSDTATNGVPVTLTETVRRGLFRGFATLVDATNATASAQLRARNADVIRARYFTASANSVFSATAVVDTTAPVITNLVVVPDYESATVSWETSKPADALVQYGESAFLGRTAYDDNLSGPHEARLTGLKPDRVYYFRVVSRDAAGNVATDDGQGKLRTLKTWKPVAAPFLWNFDAPENNWGISTSGEQSGTVLSETAWRIGTPANGLETTAPSPPNAAGSNLDGKAIQFADTDLTSPAIELTGGNRATLEFRQSFDFTPHSDLIDFETGSVLVSTDNGRSWTSLQVFGGKSSGWETAQLDLTPYLEHVVRLRWNYNLFAFEGFPRPGWLVDDVAVRVSTLLHGTIQVSNNLAQASFKLDGPVSRTGQGTGFSLAGAPTGRYVITFGEVPYYVTPPAQTNELAANATLGFQGEYTFPDANANGISDLWELHHFGKIGPEHSRDADADHDGFSDFAEFIAGTDPVEATSFLAISSVTPLANGGVRIDWTGGAGRIYQILGSTNAVDWTAYSSWTRVPGARGSATLPPMDPGVPHFFRLQVGP
jgi:hypothetical protein